MKVLISGYGSIGQKHKRILNSNFKIQNFLIINSTEFKNKIILRKKILKFDPDYIIISTFTSNHYNQLLFLNNILKNKKILVEKPLYDLKIKYKLFKFNNEIYVGYNLRFDPIIIYLKKLLNNKKILSYNAICNSFLPNWRKSNYELSSSAQKKYGGGVVSDLSHEIDYTFYLLGDLNLLFNYSSKISKLKINTNDYFILNARSKNTLVNINLNYFSRIEKRIIYIDGDDFSITVDLIRKNIQIQKNNKIKKITFKYTKNQSYINMHNYILKNKNGKINNIKSYKKIQNFLFSLNK